MNWPSASRATGIFCPCQPISKKIRQAVERLLAGDFEWLAGVLSGLTPRGLNMDGPKWEDFVPILIDATDDMIDFAGAYNSWRLQYVHRNFHFNKLTRWIFAIEERISNKYDLDADFSLDECGYYPSISKNDLELIERCTYFYNKNVLHRFEFHHYKGIETAEAIIQCIVDGKSYQSGIEPSQRFVVVKGLSTAEGITYVDLSVNINKSNKAIFTELSAALENLRQNIDSKNDNSPSIIKCPYPEYYEASHLGGYRKNSDRARAIGLWLWDRVQEYGGKRGALSQALTDLAKSGHLHSLGLEHVDDGDLRRWHKWTDDCIQAAKVLPFTKRKKGTKNAE